MMKFLIPALLVGGLIASGAAYSLTGKAACSPDMTNVVLGCCGMPKPCDDCQCNEACGDAGACCEAKAIECCDDNGACFENGAPPPGCCEDKAAAKEACCEEKAACCEAEKVASCCGGVGEVCCGQCNGKCEDNGAATCAEKCDGEKAARSCCSGSN